MWTDESKTEQKLYINKPSHFDGLTPEEKKEILKTPNLTKTDIQKVNEIFKPYIFYKRTSEDHYKCFCTHCNKGFFICTNESYESSINSVAEYATNGNSKIKHNTLGKCPHCGVHSEFKSAGFSQKNLSSHQNVIVYKLRKDVLYALCFVAYKAYNGDEFNRHWANGYYGKNFKRMSDIVCDFQKLYILKPRNTAAFAVRNLYVQGNWTESYVKPQKMFTEPLKTFAGWGYQTYYYENNYINTEIIENSFLKYAPLEMRTHITELQAVAQYPIFEIVQKMGFLDLRSDLIYRNVKNVRICDWNAKSPKAFFKHLNMSEVKAALKAKAGTKDIREYQTLKIAGTPKTFDYIVLKRYVKSYCTKAYKLNLFDVALKYLKNQNYKRNYAGNIKDGFILYNDYLSFAEKSDFDMKASNILFPRNIYEAHENAVAVYNAKLEEEQAKREEMNRKKKEKEKREFQKAENAYFKRKKKLEKLYGQFNFENLCIIVPDGISDIVEEGKVLCHCVGGYAKRHIEGKTTILFLRKKDNAEERFYTLEVRDKQLCQCYGFHDNQSDFYDYTQNKKVLLPNNEKTEQILRFEKEFRKFVADPQHYKISERAG